MQAFVDLFGRDGQGGDADAAGVVDGVGDGGAGAEVGGLADAFGATGAGAVRAGNEDGLQVRHVAHGRHLVVAEMGGGHAAVDDQEILHDGLPEAVGDAAVDLALMQGGMDDLANVVSCRKAIDGELAGVAIDGDLGHLAGDGDLMAMGARILGLDGDGLRGVCQRRARDVPARLSWPARPGRRSSRRRWCAAAADAGVLRNLQSAAVVDVHVGWRRRPDSWAITWRMTVCRPVPVSGMPVSRTSLPPG